jgi:hypothetical protein
MQRMKKTLFTSFPLSDDEQKRGRKGKKCEGQKKVEKLLSSLLLFVFVFFPF